MVELAANANGRWVSADSSPLFLPVPFDSVNFKSSYFLSCPNQFLPAIRQIREMFWPQRFASVLAAFNQNGSLASSTFWKNNGHFQSSGFVPNFSLKGFLSFGESPFGGALDIKILNVTAVFGLT